MNNITILCFHCHATKYKLNANDSKQEVQNRGNGRSKKRYKKPHQESALRDIIYARSSPICIDLAYVLGKKTEKRFVNLAAYQGIRL